MTVVVFFKGETLKGGGGKGKCCDAKFESADSVPRVPYCMLRFLTLAGIPLVGNKRTSVRRSKKPSVRVRRSACVLKR